MPEKKKNVHEGHRQRMKKRFLENGIDSFTDIQVLETLLFYSVPLKDTNETAHFLLDEFGSLKGVFEAKYEDLLKVNGVGENSASLIKLFQMISKRYHEETFSDNNVICLKNLETVKDFCYNLFLGETDECLYVIGMDSLSNLIKRECLCKGIVNMVEVSARKVSTFIANNNCTKIIISHNHPAGALEPSAQDIKMTICLKDMVQMTGVEFVDHIIVNKNGAVSMRCESPKGKGIWANV